METKKCPSCNRELTPELFGPNKARKDGLQANCKECKAKYNKEHYLKNKNSYFDSVKRTNERIKKWLKEYRETLKCSKCGESRFYVLDFHHINQETKENEIARLVKKGSLRKIKLEIEKCEVLCANCHREFHYNKRNGP